MLLIIIFVPTGTPSLKEAIDKAIEKVPGGVALVDGVVYHKWFYIPYIYGEFKYTIEGTILIDPSLTSSESLSNYAICSLDEDGQFSIRDVNKDEYLLIKKQVKP